MKVAATRGAATDSTTRAAQAAGRCSVLRAALAAAQRPTIGGSGEDHMREDNESSEAKMKVTRRQKRRQERGGMSGQMLARCGDLKAALVGRPGADAATATGE